MKHVIIVGGGFAGLNAAKILGNKTDIRVTLIDNHNHHLFQPLLYQVAMAALSPAEIAVPIRRILAGYANITVLQDEVTGVDPLQRIVTARECSLHYDYLLLACGVKHAYFGHEEWEEYAPGLKTIEQATEIRRRVLSVFEEAERTRDCSSLLKHFTFVIVGGGPTGVEMAGAIGEICRYTLAKDFRNINPRQARIILIEAGPRILPSFSEKMADKAAHDLGTLGVQVRVASPVTNIDGEGVQIGDERLEASTILWAAGVEASPIGRRMGVETDRLGRIVAEADLSIKNHPEIFVAGDLASFSHGRTTPLPGLAPVALQQGRFIARNILRETAGKNRRNFRYLDKGQMATIGRSKAIIELGSLRLQGFLAWLAWVVIHIYYLISFENKFFVTLHWVWSFFKFRRGARLIINKEWRFYRKNTGEEHKEG
ncbi:MAG: NAD(P)/FAD-dependent oxidoreductase [Proteobacteria bacterium]|nr:NAD(P)/FAD-dependent oxidoreductase [Pseudomonadota bacterium]MBU4294520.1 NAD(P)/FAD-dependent oxidoreductase [Pseudomonadota bacterium]MCG2747056.1 NAD(P)/FAD-dependent oxidoreductase [Desulfobulbaceae bacterium]